MAEKKNWYLSNLQSLYAEQLDSYESLANYHLPDDQHQKDSILPLVLVNQLKFDPGLPGPWGLFWMETIDPCHRQLMPYYLQWRDIKGKKPPFFYVA